MTTEERQTASVSAPKKRRIWLWILGWILLFPVPVILLLKRSRMKTVGKVFLIIAAWIGWMMLFSLAVVLSGTPQKNAERQQDAEQLQTEGFRSDGALLFDCYPALREIEACATSDAAPASTENFVILRLEDSSDRILAKNSNGDHSCSRALTRAEAESLDFIVLAVTGSYTKYYAPYIDGKQVGEAFPVRIGKAGLYYFDTETGTVFFTDKVHAAEPGYRKEDSQRNYRLSDGQIVKAVDRHIPLKLGAAKRFGLWFVQDLGFLLFIGLAAAAGLFLLVRSAWLDKRKREAAGTRTE